MVTKKNIYFILTSIFLFSCAISEDFPYDRKALTYKNQFLFNNQLRMDGMYLMKDQYGVYLHYFFQNGSYCAMGIDYDENDISCYQMNSRSREIPYVWGYFIIEEGILKVQTYDPHSMDRYTKYKVMERWAEIVNDTTIHFFKGIGTDGKSSDIDQTFHFKYCTNKPDSTNILMRD